MTQHNAIKLFEAKKVRTVWDDIEERWYFSIVDGDSLLYAYPVTSPIDWKRKDIRGNVFSFLFLFGRKSNKYLR